MFPPKKGPAGPPRSFKAIRQGLSHTPPTDPDGDSDGQPVSCPSCGAALNLSVDKTAGAGAAPGGDTSGTDTGSPDIGDEGMGGGL